MSLDLDDPKAAARPHPSRRWWLIAVAAVVVVVAVVSAVVMWVQGDDGGPAAGPAVSSPASSSPAPSTSPSAAQSPASSSTAPPAPRAAFTLAPAPARCMIPSATLLGRHPLAFEGTVTAIHGNAVSLDVSDTLAGRVAHAVVVRRPPRTTETSVTFHPGHTYLLAAGADGAVAGCGFSGEKTPRLTRLYAAAFG